MAVNYINQSLESITITSTSVTLGYQPGNTEVPSTLIIWAGTTGTVTLPPISTVLPNFTTVTNFNVGTQPLKVQIKSLTGSVINVSCNSANVFFGGDAAIVISSTGAKISFLASITDQTWYQV